MLLVALEMLPAALEMRTCFFDNKSARLWDIVEVHNDPMVNFHDLGSRLNLLMEVCLATDRLIDPHRNNRAGDTGDL